MQKRPELLIPLNDWKSLTPHLGAIRNSDAVYFGLSSNFSMRDRAGNFTENNLRKLVNTVHNQKKKIFLCTNIVIYENELESLRNTINLAKKYKVDAVICEDIAAIMIAKEVHIPFHISTQANISNSESAKFYDSLGAERLILSRELSLNQIMQIISQITVPVETFIHGAMCTSISGRCYFSSELMNFNTEYSANRGKCVQPCRRYYTFKGEEGEEIKFEPKSGMFFNAKDLCMIDHIDDLIKAGISSFKIEGRMRDPLYISETAACYREAIDSYFNGTYTPKKIKTWKKRLEKVFNRGFHSGFYYGKPGPNTVERAVRGNVSKWKKKYVGKVVNYYRKANAVEVEITSGQIQLGQEIIFENTADFYYKQEVKSLMFDDKSIEKTPMASAKNHIIAGISINQSVPINTRVFIYSRSNRLI
ncbi:MAG: peptidase U32 family protein [Promethearchaeota archaeon]